MLGRTVRVAKACWLACIWLAACTAPAITPGPLPTPRTLQVPVTVEVTRIVTQTLLVEPTPSPPVPCAPPDINAASVITVGAILPLSLPGAMPAGFNMQTALNLAVDDINAEGGVDGRELLLVSYDSAGRAERGAELAARLIVEDCATALVGFYHSQVTLAAAEVAHIYGVPMIVAEAPADAITALQYPEVFRLAPATSILAGLPAAWLTDVGDYNLDGEIFADVIVQGVTATTYIEGVLSGFQSAGIHYETIPVDLPSSDFSSAIARIVAMEQLPDAVFILLKGDAALAFAQQLLSAGIGPHKSTLIVLQHEGQDSTQFWEAVPNGVGTVIARIGPWPATVTDIGSRFADDYAQYSSTWPPASAFAAYDAVYVLHSAILAAQSLAGPDLVQALESTDLEVTGSLIRFPYNAGNPPGEAGAPAYNWHQHLSPQMLYLQYSVPEQPAQEVPVIWPAQYKTADLLTLR